jgi:ABC-2 type transport system permease protein
VIFMASLLPLAPTVLTREGKLFSQSQMLPVAPAMQLRAKFWYVAAVNTICACPLYIIGMIVTKPGLLNLLVTTAVTLAGIGLITSLGMLIDLFNPFFDWDNPQRAVKNNANVIISLVLGLALIAAGAALAYLAYRALPWWLGSLLLLVVLLGVEYGLFRWEIALAEKRFREIEL